MFFIAEKLKKLIWRLQEKSIERHFEKYMNKRKEEKINNRKRVIIRQTGDEPKSYCASTIGKHWPNFRAFTSKKGGGSFSSWKLPFNNAFSKLKKKCLNFKVF